MHSSPISTWDGAAAYFTFAHSPSVVGLIFILAVAATVGVIGVMFAHEKHSFERIKNGG
jgi:hypothetical protein